jgi:hypothetical protein
LRQSWFTGLAGIVVGLTMFDTASSSSGADRVVATVVGSLCVLIGVVFAAAVIVLRREQPPTSKTRVRDTSFRWPERLRRLADTGATPEVAPPPLVPREPQEPPQQQREQQQRRREPRPPHTDAGAEPGRAAGSDDSTDAGSGERPAPRRPGRRR